LIIRTWGRRAVPVARTPDEFDTMSELHDTESTIETADETSEEKLERRRSGDRRAKSDRRASVERRSGLDRRRGPGRRRGEVRKEAEEGEISGDLLEFVMTVDEYKRVNQRPYPTISEIFEIVQYLGYRKVAERAGHINIRSQTSND